MNTKQLIMIGTLAILITFSSGALKEEWNTAAASPLTLSGTGPADAEEAEAAGEEALYQALGVASSQELYDALYDGETMADIALSRGKDVNAVISLQSEQLKRQLEERLASGSISAAVYEAQLQEVEEIVAASIYGL